MMKLPFLLLLLLFAVNSNFAQRLTSNKYGFHSFKIEKAATVSPMDIKEDWQIQLRSNEMPSPGGTGWQAQLRKLKKLQSERYPVKYGSNGRSQNRSANPIPGRMFEGNLMGNGVPNDNDIAISDEGFIVSVINSSLFMYDSEADTMMQTISLGAFTLPLNITNSKFDPKIVYDPMAKRFALVFLNGSTYQTSKIIICFSTTSNPTDPWNMYKISGNPLNNSTWSDYPVIGISNQDLFIGINTFTNGSVNNNGFVESCFWQIGLGEGYAGDTLITAYYNDILAPVDTLFNITPIAMGGENVNLDMYLLSNKNLAISSDTIYLLKISGALSLGTPSLSVSLLKSDVDYFLPVDAQQPNGHFFDNGDCRIYGGYRVTDHIQFVTHSFDTATGLNCLYHGFIYDIDGSPYVKAKTFVDSTHFIGYPNIAWTGVNTSESQSIITFDYVSSSDPGAFGAIQFANDSSYSSLINLKSGNSFVNVISGTDERWGDYSGIQRRYNDPCRVWASGHFAKSTSSNGTWIAEISSDSLCPPNPVANVSNLKKETTSKLYPNPSDHLFILEFEVDYSTSISFRIYDAMGNEVIVLLDERIKPGKSQLQFSTAYLKNGTYFLKGIAQNGELITKKFVVLH